MRCLQVLLGGQWLEGLKDRWLSFAEQASSPTFMLSGAATATAAVLLAFPFHSSFPDKVAKVSVLACSNLRIQSFGLSYMQPPMLLHLSRQHTLVHPCLYSTSMSSQLQYLRLALLCVLPCTWCGDYGTGISEFKVITI